MDNQIAVTNPVEGQASTNTQLPTPEEHFESDTSVHPDLQNIVKSTNLQPSHLDQILARFKQEDEANKKDIIPTLLKTGQISKAEASLVRQGKATLKNQNGKWYVSQNMPAPQPIDWSSHLPALPRVNFGTPLDVTVSQQVDKLRNR